MFAAYDQTKAWDRPPNDRLAAQLVPPLICPSSYNPQDAQSRYFTGYSMLTGPHTVGENPMGTAIKQITDGTSNTLLVVEACGARIIWTEPRDIDTSARPAGINLKGTTPGTSAGWSSSYHWKGTHVLLADGSVRFISAEIDPVILKKLATIDGGEIVGYY